MSYSQPSTPTDFSAVDHALEEAVAAGKIPGVVGAVTDRSGIVYERAFGLASRSRQVPMRTDAVFRVASMTKLITTIAVMMLREEGKLELDDPLVEHVPSFKQPGVLVSFDDRTAAYTVRDAARPITIRDLLTHTSGFGYWFLDAELLREANGRIEFFDAPFLMHDPGTRFSYGISTDVLGQVIEPLSGLRLEKFIEQRIVRPLGMRSTSFDVPRQAAGLDAGRLTGLHRCGADGLVDPPNESRGDPPRGGGGLYMTGTDYLAVLRMLLNGGVLDGGGRLLEEASVTDITTNQIGELFAEMQTTVCPERTLDFTIMDGTQKFGFGVTIETRDHPSGRRASSFGWAGIFNTYYWADPKSGIAAVLLMQMSPFCHPDCIAVLRAFERAVYSSSSSAAS